MHKYLFHGYGNGGIDEKIKLLSHPGAEILRVKLGQLALNWPYLALFGLIWPYLERNISASGCDSNLLFSSIPPFSYP